MLRPRTNCPSRERNSSSPSRATASAGRSVRIAAGASSCSSLNQPRSLARRSTGTSWRVCRFQAATQRFFCACSGPASNRKRTADREIETLKWQCFLYPRLSRAKATHVSSGGFTVRRACLATCTNASAPPTRATSGRSSRPTASSFGRIRVLIACMRGLNPGISNTLKSDGVKPVNDMRALLLLRLIRGVGIQGEDGTPDAPEVEPGEVGRGQSGGVHLDDLPGDRLEGGPIVNRGLHDQDLLHE